MSEVMIPHNAILLVCDGAKALIMRNDGTLAQPELSVIETFSEKHPPTHELGTDHPGRAFSTSDGRRSSVSAPDFHDDAEMTFIKSTADRLDMIVRDAKSEALILVAPPRALGHLRNAVSSAIAAIVVAEIASDLTSMPTGEIARHISG